MTVKRTARISETKYGALQTIRLLPEQASSESLRIKSKKSGVIIAQVCVEKCKKRYLPLLVPGDLKLRAGEQYLFTLKSLRGQNIIKAVSEIIVLPPPPSPTPTPAGPGDPGSSPTPDPTDEPTQEPTPEPSVTATPTASPSATPTAIPTAIPSPTASPTPTATPTATPTPTSTPTPTPNSPPTGSLTAPVNGAVFTAPANISLKANASDVGGSVARVEFYRGATLLATDTSSPYSYTWNVSTPGGYSLSVKVYDNTGLIFTSSSVSVTVNPAPTPTPTPTPTPSPTPTPTATPVPSPTDGSLVFTLPSSSRVNAFWSAADVSAFAKQFVTNPATSPAGLNPIAASSRLFPASVPTSLESGSFLTQAGSSPLGLAGWWDDVALSADGNHSTMNFTWTGSNLSINLSSQKMQYSHGIMSVGANYYQLAAASNGTNYSHQSTAVMGHHMLETVLPYIEKNYASLNIVDGAPACHSFVENSSGELFDSYDSIVTSRYNSLGCSTSEVPAMNKMYIAGGYLPRVTKDLLKSTGNYALVLNYLFRKALPWVDAQGQELPADSEVLLRPAYLSRGTEASTGDGWVGYGNELLTHNMLAHRYDSKQHMLSMIQEAAAMTTVPPVAVLKVSSVKVSAGSNTILNETAAPLDYNARRYVPMESAYSIRTNVPRNQTVALTLDLSNSFDLSGRNLTFKIKALYPNHQPFLQLEKLTGGKVRLSFTAGANLPLGRAPVTILADNGITTGPVATVNFLIINDINSPPAYMLYLISGSDPNYWFTNGYYYHNRDARARFNTNQRPVVTVTGSPKQVVAPNSSVTFNISCSDPEGFTTRWYRNKGDPGQFTNATQFKVNASEVSQPQDINLICSDGTGVFSGAKVRVCPSSNSGSCS